MATNSSNSNTGNGSGGSGTNTGGSSGSGSSGSGSTPSGTTPIDGLTTNLKQIEDSGPADIKLSSGTQQQYLNIINAFIGDLKTQRTAMANVQPLGNPGTLTSAIQTKSNLELDVHGPGGITETTDKYLTYLADFVDTVNKAASRLIQSG